jgi:hypothetical protein
MILSLFVMGLWMDDHFSVQRTVTIRRSKADVFAFVKYLKNHQHFSGWVLQSPKLSKNSWAGDGRVGFAVPFEGEQKTVGAGEQKIIEIDTDGKIETELRFSKPEKAINYLRLTTKVIARKQTKVTWSYTGTIHFPLNFVLLFMNFDSVMGAELEAGLSRLKIELEKDIKK